MDKHSFPSIEKFAAFLDGNMPQEEMQQFSYLAEHDGTFRQLLDANTIIDDTISGFSESDLQLPPEITDSSFEIPSIPTHDISHFDTLSIRPFDDLIAASATCFDEDSTPFPDSPTWGDNDISNELDAPFIHNAETDIFNSEDSINIDDINSTFPDF